MNTEQVLERIFRDPNATHSMTEFQNLGRPVHDIITIYPRIATTGKDAGRTKYFIQSFVPFPSGNTEAQVYVDGGRSAPEEIVRQLWLYRLISDYGYLPDEIDIERSVHFGTEISTKAADIVVYADSSKTTPKIIIECKKPNRKDGIEQLKSYMNAKGAPIALWSNGSDRIILYRPYPALFDDTLSDLPRRGQSPADVLNERRTISDLRTRFDFKKIIQDLEELVLADSGKDEFNEIFKLIFAKIFDEKQALEVRAANVLEFRKSLEPDLTYERINGLFKNACEEWPGIFRDGEEIELAKRHLQVCVGPIEGVKLLGSNLRIMDDAFEYLLPAEAKKKKGQFFTPRHVVEMCVRMLNPKRDEYVIDPACGSGGFLLHAMEWCYPAETPADQELRKHRYASKYLWGIDFEQRAAKTSRALMLIAGDGHTNIFGPDVSSLDPRTWYESASGQTLMLGLRKARLTANKIPDSDDLRDEDRAWEFFGELRFDVVLANPPFAGELKDRKMLAHYDLAKPALARAGDNKAPKEERDVLFIERIVRFLRPGGRAAIVLPQGKFNNASLGYIRNWIMRRARLLAVVGLHANTFKPHTGTKTSVLFIQRYTDEELKRIDEVEQQVAQACPDFAKEIADLLVNDDDELDQQSLPEVMREILSEEFQPFEAAAEELDGAGDVANGNGSPGLIDGNARASAPAEEELQSAIDAATAALAALSQGNDPNKRSHSKIVKKQIKELAQRASAARIERLRGTTRGLLQLASENEELVARMRERWIAGAVAKELDYPVFMAVSERGGKDNSGEYVYLTNENGVLQEFDENHPNAGQVVVDQDLVNYEITPDKLKIGPPENSSAACIAEAFVSFAREQGFSFWSAS